MKILRSIAAVARRRAQALRQCASRARALPGVPHAGWLHYRRRRQRYPMETILPGDRVRAPGRRPAVRHGQRPDRQPGYADPANRAGLSGAGLGALARPPDGRRTAQRSHQRLSGRVRASADPPPRHARGDARCAWTDRARGCQPGEVFGGTRHLSPRGAQAGPAHARGVVGPAGAGRGAARGFGSQAHHLAPPGPSAIAAPGARPLRAGAVMPACPVAGQAARKKNGGLAGPRSTGGSSARRPTPPPNRPRPCNRGFGRSSGSGRSGRRSG